MTVEGSAVGEIDLFWGNVMGKTKPIKLTATKLKRIAELSGKDRGMTFNYLMPHFNKENLIGCFHELDGKKAVGIDRQTKEEYGANLESNLENLIGRMKTMSYRPQAVREVMIPKGDGQQRPLGISCIEDKIVQLMSAKVLEAIYEPVFKDCSFGFRPGLNCHGAIKTVLNQLYRNWVNVVIDLDLENFFGAIEHSKLLALLRMKIKDETFIRYIARMLKSGIMSRTGFRRNKDGTVQGSVCSPILANIFAHYALDLWFEEVVQRHTKRKVKLVRYCDDIVVCCTDSKDASRILAALKKRLARFSLKMNETKTKVVTLDKNRYAKGKKQETFDFLGFSFYLSSNNRGTILPKVRSSRKRVRRKLKEIKEWVKRNRHKKRLKALWLQLIGKMRGYVRYYGVSHNTRQVSAFISKVVMIFYKWMNRRSQKKSVSWEKFYLFMKQYPMVPVKVHHNLF